MRQDPAQQTPLSTQPLLPESTPQSTPASNQASNQAPTTPPTHVVGIGASAGGLEALEQLFRAMPANTGMAFVVIQHLSPDFKSLMSELLERFTPMPAIPVVESETIRPDTIYLVSPRKNLIIRSDRLISVDRDHAAALSMPIDVFFHSLANSWGKQAVAVVLSGTGADGSVGILDVRDAGGLVLVESPDTARFDGMPRSAIETGVADAILPPAEMPRAMLAFLDDRSSRNALGPDTTDEDACRSGFPAILKQLNRRYHIDFNDYKASTIMRRIERRLLAMDLAPDDFESYSQRLAAEPKELDTLYEDLLIGVTGFFRDPDAFLVLRQSIVPQLLEQTADEEELRLWICGCSTGEEAYSIAALFLDAFAHRKRQPRLKVLATDIYEDALLTASDGIYDKARFADMPANLFERYFEPRGDNHYKVTPELRRCLIFSVHNLLSDPPFTRVHLVSCRNLLIYLKPLAKNRALTALCYALRIKGILFLGSSETPGELTGGLQEVDQRSKLYRKGSAENLPRHYQAVTSLADSHESGAHQMRRKLPRIYATLLDHYLPASILINEQRQILHLFGDASRYIHPGNGRFSGDVLHLVSETVSLALTSALRTAATRRDTVVLRGIRERNADYPDRTLTISVDPFIDSATKEVFFNIRIGSSEETSLPATDDPVTPARARSAPMSADREQELERELASARQSLETTVEELETTNEELHSSNEELMAANEELQSTNEELHSVNEELYSVNAEHELKLDELNRTSSDLRNLIQSTDTATIFVDNDGKLQLYTPRALEVFNLMPQDLGRQLKHFQTLLPDDRLFDDIDRVMKDKTSIEHPIQHGGYSFLRRCNAYFDTHGNQQGVVINYTETTLLTTTLQALKSSETRLEALMEHSPATVWIKDAQGAFVYVNQTYEQRFGVRLIDCRGKTDADLWPAEIARQFRDNDLQVLASGQPRECDEQMPATDGSQSPWRIIRFPIDDADGARYIAGIGIDVTARKQAEDALALSESRFRQVTETLPQLVWTCTADGNCDYISPQWVRYTGKAEADQLGYGWLEPVHPDDREATVALWHQANQDGERFETEFRLRAADGQYRWFRALAVPLRDDSGRVIKWFGSNSDIHEILQARERKEQLNKELEERVEERTAELEQEKRALQASEAALREAITKADAANQAKSRFLATMSHEIRTPLNAIIGTSLILEENETDGDQRQLFATLESASRNLLAQISDILDLAKIEAGEIAIERIAFDVQLVLSEIARIFAPEVRTKGLDLVLPDGSGLALPLLMGDGHKIQQMLANLVSNALKFTEQGRIEIQLEVLERTTDQLTLRLRVCDTGIGIAPDVLSQLFQPFTQADESITRTHGGTGLGLSLVRLMAERLGGKVGVESTLGAGSRFWFDLPLGIATADAQLAENRAQIQPLHLLVIDQEPAGRERVTAMAEQLGWRIEALASTDGMLSRLDKAAPPQQPQINCVLLDWGSLASNDPQTLAALCKRLKTFSVIVLLLVAEPDRAALQQASMAADAQPDGILVKPVTTTDFFNAVNAAHFARSPTTLLINATRIGGAHSHWLADLRVLVVDDSRLNLEVCDRLLKREGAKPELCESAAAALEVATADPHAFDVVLMDVRMPLMDGYEATRRLRLLMGDAPVPIIALTAGVMASERAKAQAAGMNDFLTKPIDPAQLIRSIRRQVVSVRGQPLPLTPRAPHAAPPGQAIWPAIAGLELDPVRARLGDDLALFLELLERFMQEGVEQLDRAREALTDQRAEAAAAALHRLRGQAANIGAMELWAALTELEQQAQADALSVAGLAPVSAQLLRLREALDALGLPPAADADSRLEDPTPAAPLDAAALASLKFKLSDQSMEALDAFKDLTPALRGHLGAETFRRLEQAMAALDFDTASAVLNAPGGSGARFGS